MTSTNIFYNRIINDYFAIKMISEYFIACGLKFKFLQFLHRHFVANTRFCTRFSTNVYKNTYMTYEEKKTSESNKSVTKYVIHVVCV